MRKNIRTIFACLKPNNDGNNADEEDKAYNGDGGERGDDSFVDDGAEVGRNCHDRVTICQVVHHCLIECITLHIRG